MKHIVKPLSIYLVAEININETFRKLQRICKIIICQIIK